MYRLAALSTHEHGMEQIFGQPAAWVGLDNFREILNERYFWTVLWRTLIFCAQPDPDRADRGDRSARRSHRVAESNT